MDKRRLIIFTVCIVACNAGHLGYNYRETAGGFADNLDVYPPLANRKEYTKKSFYFFTAPEEDDVPERISNRVTSDVKKNLQVVFIKAPEYKAYTNAALNLAQQALQTKTVIYLLSKQPDIAEVEKRYQEIHSTIDNTPEVRFIKYRTAEDAKQAQQIIRSQYENLPGNFGDLNDDVSSAFDYDRPSTSSRTSKDDALYTASRPPYLPTGIDVVPGSSYLPPERD